MTRRLCSALRTFYLYSLQLMSLVAQYYTQPTLFLSVLPRGPSSPSYLPIGYLFICFPPTAACAQHSLSPRLSSRVTRSRRTDNACLFVKTLCCTPNLR